MRRTRDELKKMRKAGRVVAEMHEKIRAAVKPGVTTKALDTIGREVIEKRGARVELPGYYMGTYPGVICASPNDTIVHGIPGDYRFRDGDIISIDCGAIVQGYHGDAAFTMGVGEVTDEADRLMKITEESLHAGIARWSTEQRIGDIGYTVSRAWWRRPGYSVVEGVHRSRHRASMHETPEVPNVGRPGKGPKLRIGDVYAVEPMVNVGSADTYELDDGWTVKTADGSLSAHCRAHRSPSPTTAPRS